MREIDYLILSNFLSSMSFLLVIISSLWLKKSEIRYVLQASVVLTVFAYGIIGCFHVAVVSVFTSIRQQAQISLHVHKNYRFIKAIILIAGTWASFVAANIFGSNWIDFLPVWSFVFCSIGKFLITDPKKSYLISVLNIALFWLIFNYTHLMAFNVLQDLFVIGFPLANKIVEYDRMIS